MKNLNIPYSEKRLPDNIPANVTSFLKSLERYTKKTLVSEVRDSRRGVTSRDPLPLILPFQPSAYLGEK